MHTFKLTFQRLCQAAAILGLLAGAAQAQTPPPVYQLDIPAQPLGDSLKALATNTGQQVVFEGSSVRGKLGNPLHGSYSVNDAVAEVIQGSGLNATRSARGVIVIAAADVPPPTQAQAQSSSAAAPVPAAPEVKRGKESAMELEEIVVTAQLREQRAVDVPISLTVTTGEQLKQANIVDLQDLSARLPNIKIATAPGAGLLNIRGLGSGNNAGFEQSVGTFVDGVYRGRSRAIAAALFDVERVEVLKGPQTTFFGNNVIAGALNISTVKPGKVFTYNASTLYAPKDGEYAVEGGVTLPITDTLSTRIAAKWYGMDGFSYNELTGKHEPHRNDKIARISVAWEPTDNWDVAFRFDRGRNRDRGALANEVVNCPAGAPYPAPLPTSRCGRYLSSGQPVDDQFNYRSAKADSFNNYDFAETELVNRIKLGQVTLVATSGYFTHDANMVSMGTPVPVPGIGGGASGATLNFAEHIKQYTQELRLQSDTGGALSYVVGAYYSREKLNAPLYVGFYFAPFGLFAGPPYTPGTPVASYEPFEQTTNTYSAFASLSAALTDALTLNLGARYSKTDKTVYRDIIYGSGAPVAGPDAFTPAPSSLQPALLGVLGGVPGNFADPDRSYKKFMPSVNLQYKFTPDVIGYTSFTKGFKAGGFAVDQGQVEFDSENVDAYEAGLKANLFDRRMYSSIAVFRSNYKGLQEAIQNILPSGVVIPTVANVGGARSQGVEFSATFRVTNTFAVNADVAYLDAKFTDYPNAPCTTLANLTSPCVQDMSGKQRGFAPKYSGNVGASITVPVMNNIDLRIDPSVNFTSRYFQSSTADPLFEQPGYAKMDLRLGLGPQDRSWEVAVIGKNLNDKRTASFRQSVATSPGTYYVVPERPLSVAVQLSIRH